MLRVVPIALAALLLCGDARSQEPAQKADTPAADTTKAPEADQRGSETVPLVVKVLPAPAAETEAEDIKHEREEKALIDKKLAFETQRIADYTRYLAGFTLFLFFVAFGQAILFVWQLVLIRRGANDATIAAKAAQTSAELARSEFIATHRPRLRVYGFEVDGWDTHGVPLSVLFRAQNVGESPARILRVEGTIFIAPRNTLPLQRAIHLGFIRDRDLPLASGERDAFEVDDGPVLTEYNATAVYAGQTPVYCIGRVTYRDDNMVEREIGFCRRFRFRPYQVETVSDEDYEYAY